MKKIVIKILKYFAIKHHKYGRLYLKLANLNSSEYADYLKEIHYFYSLGNNCRINRAANATDPQLVKIGNNVTLSNCTLLCHDGVIGIMNVIYQQKFDSVGKIEIGDNVFIGHGSIVMPNVTIGANAIVAAGALVTKNVESGYIVAGVPAKPIGTLDDLAKKMRIKTDAYPWAGLIMQRESAFDATMEVELLQMRQAYFFLK